MVKKKKRPIKKKSQTANTGNSIKNMILRYLALILIALPGSWIFYKIFTPLTFYPVYFLTDLIYGASRTSNISFLVTGGIPIELIGACIAGSAYYLLLILNFSTPGIEPIKRIYAVLFSFILFLIMNIIRILVLISLAVSGSSYFDVTHLVFWYGLSTIIVVGIWFAEVKLFNITKIPFFSDLNILYRLSSLKR